MFFLLITIRRTFGPIIIKKMLRYSPREQVCRLLECHRMADMLPKENSQDDNCRHTAQYYAMFEPLHHKQDIFYAYTYIGEKCTYVAQK